MTHTNITNGTSTHNVDTTNMDYGDYSVNATFTDENTYNTAQSISMLTVKNPYATIIANTHSTDEWILTNDNGQLKNSKPNVTSNGVQSGTYQYLIWTQPLKMNSTVTLNATTTSTYSTVFCGVTNSLVNWTWHSHLVKDNGNAAIHIYNYLTRTGEDLAIVPGVTTSYTVTIKILPTTLEYTVNGVDYVVNNRLVEGLSSDEFFLCFRKWGSGNVTVNHVEYTPPRQ